MRHWLLTLLVVLLCVVAARSNPVGGSRPLAPAYPAVDIQIDQFQNFVKKTKPQAAVQPEVVPQEPPKTQAVEIKVSLHCLFCFEYE